MARPGSIDAHVHVWTNDHNRYPRAAGSRDYVPERFTPEDYLAEARPNGVSRAVLIQMSFYTTDNNYMLESMRAHPGVFAGVGIVDAQAPQPDQKMLALAQQGVRGFRITRRQPSGKLARNQGYASHVVLRGAAPDSHLPSH